MYIDSEELKTKLAFVQKGAWGKAAFPEYYKDILIEYWHESGMITARSFNGLSHFMVEIGVVDEKTAILNSSGDNKFLISPKTILSSISGLKETVFFHVDFEASRIVIKTKKLKGTDTGYRIRSGNFVDMPGLDIVDQVVDDKTILSCLESVSWAVDMSSPRRACHGVSFKANEASIEYCGTDSNVLSIATDTVNLASAIGEGIIPLPAIELMIDVLRIKSENNAVIAINNRLAVARKGGYNVASILIDERPLAYGSIINNFESVGFDSLEISRAQLYNACEFAATYIMKDEVNILYLSISGEEVKISSLSNDGGATGMARVECVDGFDAEISINYKVASGMLKSFPFDSVLIHVSKNKKLMRIIPSSSISTKNLVMMSLSAL